LKSLADALHANVAVTAAMRAVLETLHETGEQTVPQIARAKSVSRQHIQVLANELAALDMVAVRANPADKRSPLLHLTKKGKATFERMREREADALRELAAALSECDVDTALQTLSTLRVFLDGKLESNPALGQEDAS
jgi:DNA-binding MarR family transcriptional regulator